MSKDIICWEFDSNTHSLANCRFVEGMAPVFSRSAWFCTWHLLQVLLCFLPIFISITHALLFKHVNVSMVVSPFEITADITV